MGSHLSIPGGGCRSTLGSTLLPGDFYSTAGCSDHLDSYYKPSSLTVPSSSMERFT